jgi:hypothetical protein
VGHNRAMQRLRPHPLPAIHPVPEVRADARLRAVYDETKATLRVPWMGVVTMALAHYPHFYDALWQALRPTLASAAFESACASLREHVATQASSLGARPLRATLAQSGYADGELAEIDTVVEVFTRGNLPYLLLITAVRRVLEGHTMDANDDADALRPAPARAAFGPARLVLMEPHHADPATATLYDDLRGTLGLPFVNTDYRALARWPSYFTAAWADLRHIVRGPAWEPAVQSVHDRTVALAATLPIARALSPQRLHAAAARDAGGDGVLDVVRLFQWLLPGLVVNVACLRAQLLAQ